MSKSERILDAMGKFLKKDLKSLPTDTKLTTLVAESFLLVEMVIELQDHFSIRIKQEDLVNVHSVADFVRMFEGKISL